MKRTTALLLAVLLLCLSFAACKRAAPEGDTPPEKTAAILDRDGTRLGEIDARAWATAADDGIFYSVFSPKEGEFTSTAVYRFWRASDGRDVKLGALEEQSYEAVYARTALSGVLYTLALVGSPFDDSPDRLMLLACDPGKETLKTFTLSKHGFPYAALAAVGERLLIMSHEMTTPARDAVYAFDPGTEEVKELLSFDAAEDSLRGVCADGDGFRLLRLHLGEETGIFLDRFDADANKVSETPLGDLLLPAIEEVNGVENRADALNEAGMHLSRFALEDGNILVYENFGLTRLLLDLTTGKTLAVRDDLWAFAPGDKTTLFRMDFDPDDAASPEILALEHGALRPVYAEAPEGYPLLKAVSRAPSGLCLLRFSNSAQAFDSEDCFRLLTD